MNSLANPTLSLPLRRPAQALAPATRTAIDLLQRLEGGSLRLVLPDNSQLLLGHGAERATLQINDERVFRRVLTEGDIGFGESWIDGDWHSEEPAELLTLLAENRAQLARAVHGHWLPVLGHRLRHLLRANTRAGSKRNILAHYDLGNDFYQRWLDPSMSYSAALFGEQPGMSLEQAQLRKYYHLLRSLDPRPGDRILEIGCGWGGLAELAASEFGCHVHGITLSPAQLEWSRQRAKRKGFADRVEFSLMDYRDVRGEYDHVISIEMFEAVGERYWPTYFDSLRERLAPGGRAAVQTITIANERFAAYRRGTDFIQRHIFPGGMLPSPQVFERRAASADLSVRERHAFGIDYARTLAHWARNFDAAWPEIEPLGFDARFRRLWQFYLAYCEAGFRAGATNVYQFLLEKPRA